MNSLIKIEKNKDLGLVVSSRTVAEELGRRHSDVIEGLENVILENGNLRSLIIESTYQVQGQRRKYKEYLLTKDGFILYMFNIQGYNDFKMAYIEKFNEMENAIKEHNIQLPSDPMEVLELVFDAHKKTKAKVNEIETMVIDLKENQKLDPGEYNLLGKRVSQKVYETLKNYNLPDKDDIKQIIYKDINSSINKIANIRTRTQLKQKHFEIILDFINNWNPSNATLYLARQMEIDERDSELYADDKE